MEELFKWIAVYIGVGFTCVIGETFERMNRKGARINRIKIIVAWLPALIIKRVRPWVWIDK